MKKFLKKRKASEDSSDSDDSTSESEDDEYIGEDEKERGRVKNGPPKKKRKSVYRTKYEKIDIGRKKGHKKAIRITVPLDPSDGLIKEKDVLDADGNVIGTAKVVGRLTPAFAKRIFLQRYKEERPEPSHDKVVKGQNSYLNTVLVPAAKMLVKETGIPYKEAYAQVVALHNKKKAEAKKSAEDEPASVPENQAS